MAAAPNQSLYVNNLNDKLSKQDLRLNLYLLFSTYGTVLDIVALKTSKMRGQAHVVFRDIISASLAMKECNGTFFFGKEMHISYAKGQSDIISKLEGTYVPNQRKDTIQRPDHAKGVKRARDDSSEEE